MARDILVVPVSTVSSEAAFSTGGRVLDAFRSFLSSKMAKALICAQNWLSVKPPNCNDFDYDNFDETETIVIGILIFIFDFWLLMFHFIFVLVNTY